MKPTLKLSDLIFFGIICVTPIAPIPPFGIAQSLSQGHATLTILIAMLAMLPTAISYGRMASQYPVAGSAYIYVSKGLNAHLGFLAGWTTCLDYLVIPMANIIYCAATMQRVLPSIGYPLWVFAFAALSTWLNLRGIRTGVKTNQFMMLAMTTVLAAFIGLAIKYVVQKSGAGGLISTLPLYNPATFDFNHIRTATSFAALTYIGFDAVTTMAEEVQNPRRNIALATVIVCIFTGVVGGTVIYLAQLVWPEFSNFSNTDTAFMDVAHRVGGDALFGAFAVILILAQFGSALTGQAGAGRMLFGMGRDGVLPRAMFAHLDERHQLPVYNIFLVGLLAAVGALIFDFQRAAELLNFGAFFAFMGVNLAVINSCYLRGLREHRQLAWDLLLPAMGFLCCLAIWISLPMTAKKVGFAWLAIGLIYQIIATKGFQRTMQDISPSDK